MRLVRQFSGGSGGTRGLPPAAMTRKHVRVRARTLNQLEKALITRIGARPPRRTISQVPPVAINRPTGQRRPTATPPDHTARPPDRTRQSAPRPVPSPAVLPGREGRHGTLSAVLAKVE